VAQIDLSKLPDALDTYLGDASQGSLLQQIIDVILDQTLDVAQLWGSKSKITRQTYGRQPKLARRLVAVDMHVRGLVGLVRVEVDAVRATSQHGGHRASLL